MLEALALLTKMDAPFAFALVGATCAIMIPVASMFVARGPSKRALEMRRIEKEEKTQIAGVKNQTTQLPAVNDGRDY
jgi:hypothetical protein